MPAETVVEILPWIRELVEKLKHSTDPSERLALLKHLQSLLGLADEVMLRKS